MSVFVIKAPTADKFKLEFDAWVISAAPTTIHEITTGHLKGEWIIRFTP